MIQIHQHKREIARLTLLSGQQLFCQFNHMPAIEQPGQRIGGCHARQPAMCSGYRHHVVHGQIGKHQKDDGEVEDIDVQQRRVRHRLQRVDKGHQHIQPDIIGPQANRQNPGTTQMHTGKQCGNEHQQKVMEAAVPADQHYTERGMHQHLDADQHHCQVVAPLAKGSIGVGIHAHTDDVNPGQNRRTKPKENGKKTDIDRCCQLATPHGQVPKLRPLFATVDVRLVIIWHA